MDDNKSLISISKGFDCSFQRFWKHKNCFIPFFGFLVLLICLCYFLSLVTKDVSCDGDWVKFNQPCYKLVMNYSDIRECRKDCQKEGADLASVHSKEENDFIVTFGGVNMDCWQHY
eukprot:TRINITY_DN7000_c0_g1_i1.p1 TRINITY_DN7000_c0_g1~~TRINITY_DN7000_c0_g1_i1.p1  ORF type:complete len:116 (-),score=14.17 TRINITY_DN7000_c0_g1_i1:107-454(-)